METAFAEKETLSQQVLPQVNPVVSYQSNGLVRTLLFYWVMQCV